MSTLTTLTPGYNFFESDDGVTLAYQIHGDKTKKPLILLHGFTGSSAVWSRNITSLQEEYLIIAPDLRGHGRSGRRPDGNDSTVARLALDLKELMNWLQLGLGVLDGKIDINPHNPPNNKSRPNCIAGSLGCAIVWSFTEQFGRHIFDKLVWVDQAPLQNYTQDGTWGPDHGNRSLNSPESLKNMLDMLSTNSDNVYKGTINACLAYLWDSTWGRQQFDSEEAYQKAAQDDTNFFLRIAQQGDPTWFGKLMSDHTVLDWRDSIRKNFGPESGNSSNTLVIASERSGCFPAAGPMWTVDAMLDNGKGVNPGELQSQGVVVDFGGHWCYWEDAGKFNDLVLKFMAGPPHPK